MPVPPEASTRGGPEPFPGTPGDPCRRVGSQRAAQQETLPLLRAGVHVGCRRGPGPTPEGGRRPPVPGRGRRLREEGPSRQERGGARSVAADDARASPVRTVAARGCRRSGPVCRARRRAPARDRGRPPGGGRPLYACEVVQCPAQRARREVT